MIVRVPTSQAQYNVTRRDATLSKKDTLIHRIDIDIVIDIAVPTNQPGRAPKIQMRSSHARVVR